MAYTNLGKAAGEVLTAAQINTCLAANGSGEFGFDTIIAGSVGAKSFWADAGANTITFGQSTSTLKLNPTKVGINVTPSAWDSSVTGVQVGARAALAGDTANTFLGQNWYAAEEDKYIATAVAALYVQTAGTHVFRTAPSGTADTTITWTERMQIFNTGDVRIGTGSAVATTATDGFLLIPGCAGTPTGNPTNDGVGAVALVYDTTNNILYANDGAGWNAV